MTAPGPKPGTTWGMQDGRPPVKPCPSEAAYRRELRAGLIPHEACMHAASRAAAARKRFREGRPA